MKRAITALRHILNGFTCIRVSRHCYEMKTFYLASAAGLALVVLVGGGCTQKSGTQGGEEKTAVQGGAVELTDSQVEDIVRRSYQYVAMVDWFKRALLF
jgi:hypothetical protein